MDKRGHILEAAIRRFAHFGVQKTTLTEIADDLGMTKQALSYYFPDKHSLSEAVETKIIEEFFGMVANQFAGAANLERALMGFIDVKNAFLEKYAMLMQRAGQEMLGNQTRVDASKQQVRERMLQQIAELLKQGMARGEIRQVEASEIAVLLFDTMAAYEMCTVARQVVPDPKTFAELCIRQKAVIQLMLNGLKEVAWKS